MHLYYKSKTTEVWKDRNVVTLFFLSLLIVISLDSWAMTSFSGKHKKNDTDLTCNNNPRCDKQTGCILPTEDFPISYTLPEGKKTKKFLKEVAAYTQCREKALAKITVSSTTKLLTPEVLMQEENLDYIDTKLKQWNGDIFWSPASKSTDTITRFGDEARSVFGPIPPVDCRASAARTMTIEVEGNKIDLVPNPNKPGSPLEFRHSDIDGNVVRWTNKITQCDKPSIAGGVTYCGLNSRLGVTYNSTKSVEWMILCRKSGPEDSPDNTLVEAIPYWQETNPEYRLLGYIGNNLKTGEVVFFDGNPEKRFSWDDITPPPGGNGYNDPDRDEIAKLYDSGFNIQCEACHDNKEPRIVNPHVQQSRVGFKDIERAKAFGLYKIDTDPERIRNARSFEDLLPYDLIPMNTRDRFAPYRIIGTGFTHRVAAKNPDAAIEKAIRDPSGYCTGCHSITTMNTGQYFSRDALNQLNGQEYAELRSMYTKWATDRNLGAIHPWMLKEGNNLSGQEMTKADIDKFFSCIENTSRPECDAQSIFTSCPAPESTSGGSAKLTDPSGPKSFTVTVSDNTDNDNNMYSKKMNIKWNYLNSLGNVPERDDVRFFVTISDSGLGGINNIRNARNIVSGALAVDQNTLIIKDISYEGHNKWTDASQANSPRPYAFSVPVQCDKTYTVQLLPKRYCFDQEVERFGEVVHQKTINVRCD